MNFLTQSSVKFPQTQSEAPTDRILAHHAECNDDILTLILLMWRIWWASNNASRWQMGFNSAL